MTWREKKYSLKLLLKIWIAYFLCTEIAFQPLTFQADPAPVQENGDGEVKVVPATGSTPQLLNTHKDAIVHSAPLQESGDGEVRVTPSAEPVPESKTQETKDPTAPPVPSLESGDIELEVPTLVDPASEVNTEEIKSSLIQLDPIRKDAELKTEAAPAQASCHQEEKILAANVSSKELEKATIVDVGDDEASSQNQWQQKEQELLKKIEELEKQKSQSKEDGLRAELKIREEEIDLLKARVKNLETELQAAMSKPGPKNQEMIENIKQQHDELLTKARGMIFDKTKMVKNQELQIEALTTQVQSLKDINLITKDLLEIRNSEVKAMEERLEAMEARFKVEKEKYGLVLQRAQTSSSLNDDLKKEYETQLAIFKELREKYDQRVQALVAENERLKDSLKTSSSG